MTTPNPKSRREVKAMSDEALAKLVNAVRAYQRGSPGYLHFEGIVAQAEKREAVTVAALEFVLTLTESNAQRGEE